MFEFIGLFFRFGVVYVSDILLMRFILFLFRSDICFALLFRLFTHLFHFSLFIFCVFAILFSFVFASALSCVALSSRNDSFAFLVPRIISHLCRYLMCDKDLGMIKGPETNPGILNS